MHSTEPHTLNQDAGIMDAVFFSPHLDDAALSAGNRISELAILGKRILVTTIFTKGNDSVRAHDASAFLKKSGVLSATELFRKRKREDVSALHVLGCKYYTHAGLTDALFRTHSRRNDNTPLYPTFKALFNGDVTPHDSQTRQDVLGIILETLKRHTGKKTQIFGPLGAGNHTDHIIVHEALAHAGRGVFFWEDIPYRSHPQKLYTRRQLVDSMGAEFRITNAFSQAHAKRKHLAIRKYNTQYEQLLKEGMGDIDYYHERFYETKR